MLVYDWMAQVIASGEAYQVQIDLREKSLRYQEIPILIDGELVSGNAPSPHGEPTPLTGLIDFTGDPYAEIERLYAQFKRSVPRKGDRLDRGNFKSLSSDSLTYAELEENMPRQQALLLLEGFILLAVAAGILTWNNPKHFFWMGNDPDLIIYRGWVASKPITEQVYRRKV